MKCPSCGTDNRPGARFCKQCAAPLARRASPGRSAPGQVSPKPNLVVQSGPRAGQTFPLHDGANTLGRAPGNDVLLSEASVSRSHARIMVRAEGIWIEDLGSTSGTFVNGRRVTGSTWLRSGDVVQVGGLVKLSVQGVRGAPPVSPVPPSPVVAPTAAAPMPAATQTCPSCGAQNRLGVRFCEQCGAPLVAGVPAPPARPPKARRRRWIWAVGGLAVLLLAAAAVVVTGVLDFPVATGGAVVEEATPTSDAAALAPTRTAEPSPEQPSTSTPKPAAVPTSTPKSQAQTPTSTSTRPSPGVSPTSTSPPPSPTPVPTATPTELPPEEEPPPPPPAPLPEIATFESDRYTLAPGQCATIHWVTENATAVYLNEYPVEEPEGWHTACWEDLSPGTKGYVLWANRGDEGVNETLYIEVEQPPEEEEPPPAPPPQILSFESDRTTLSPGDHARLTYEVMNADEINLNWDPLPVDQSSSYDSGVLVVSYNELSEGYNNMCLRASNAVDADMLCLGLTAAPPAPPPPEIITFESDKTTVYPGDCVELHWVVENATSITLNDQRLIFDPDGQFVVCHEGPGTIADQYCLAASNGVDTVGECLFLEIEQSTPSTIVLNNHSGSRICLVHISPISNDAWGDNWLDSGETVPAGGRRTFTLASGTYDIRAIDCNDEVLDVRWGVEVSGTFNIWNVP